MLHTDPKLELIAKKVVNRLDSKYTNKDNYGSVILILMVISIILTVVRVIQECNNKKLFNLDRNDRNKIMKQQINTISIKRTWLNQIRLNRIVRQNMSKSDYNEYGEELKQAIMDVGSNLTEEESLTLMEAANV